MMTNEFALPEGYDEFLRDIKGRIQAAQVRAALALSREVVLLYWQIGQAIRERQQRHGWGAKVVPRLAADLKAAFPGVEGFSRTNLLHMRAFAEAYPDAEIVHQLVDNSPLPWRHYVSFLDKVKDPDTRSWYTRAAHQHGWSRAVLEHQIETRLHERQGQATTNFDRTLPPPQSDLARQILKDPYNFDFLTVTLLLTGHCFFYLYGTPAEWAPGLHAMVKGGFSQRRVTLRPTVSIRRARCGAQSASRTEATLMKRWPLPLSLPALVAIESRERMRVENA